MNATFSTSAHCEQCDRQVRVTEPFAFGGADRAGLRACRAARRGRAVTARQARGELVARLDELVASVPAAALPFGAEVSIWQSANDGGLKWAMTAPMESRRK